MSLQREDIEAKVKQMYIDYPYPAYVPERDVAVPLTINEGILTLNHYLYQGKKDFNGFRILVAGCGLGTTPICLSKQLDKYKNVEIVAVDLSTSSLNICRERIKKFHIKNITLHEMSLLDLTPEKFGLFDYINCIGVLHHLADPQEGLNTLQRMLKPDGGMCCMVYNKIGRTAIYHMQDMLRIINRNVDHMEKRIKNFKSVYKTMPDSCLFKKNEALISDHKKSDAGIVDLLLHHRDKPFTTYELHEWIEKAGLNFVDYTFNDRGIFKSKIPNIDYTGLSDVDQYAINELLHANIIRHDIYLSNSPTSEAKFSDLNNVLTLNFITEESLKKLCEHLEKRIDMVTDIDVPVLHIKGHNGKLGTVKAAHKIMLKIFINKYSLEVLKKIDDEKSTQEIFDEIIALHPDEDDLTHEQLLEYFNDVYQQFKLHDLILLKNKDCIINRG